MQASAGSFPVALPISAAVTSPDFIVAISWIVSGGTGTLPTGDFSGGMQLSASAC